MIWFTLHITNTSLFLLLYVFRDKSFLYLKFPIVSVYGFEFYTVKFVQIGFREQEIMMDAYIFDNNHVPSSPYSMNCTLRAMAIGVANTKAIAHIAVIDIFARNFDGIALSKNYNLKKKYSNSTGVI